MGKKIITRQFNLKLKNIDHNYFIIKKLMFNYKNIISMINLVFDINLDNRIMLRIVIYYKKLGNILYLRDYSNIKNLIYRMFLEEC